jgi:hypothetical protein
MAGTSNSPHYCSPSQHRSSPERTCLEPSLRSCILTRIAHEECNVAGLHSSSACSQGEEKSSMAHAKKASKTTRQRTALPVFGAAGASLAMAGGASAAVVPPVNGPSQVAAPYSILVLDEEEISDVSLATFYVLDRLNNKYLGEQVAQRGGCRGGGGRCGGAGGRCGGGGCAAARCGGRGCAAVARCGGRCAVARCAVRRCGGVGVVGCAGCGCVCLGCTAPCWRAGPAGWVYVC